MFEDFHLENILRDNKALVTRNVILTPFLPPKVFTPYKKFDKVFLGNGASACFADSLSVICSRISSQNIFTALELLKGSRCANIMFIGSCGGIGGAKMGDILVADQKAVLNITGLGSSFSKYLGNNGIAYRNTRVHSVESIKDETAALIDNLEKGGFGGVDLESNVFQRTSASNGLSACAVLYVTDIPRKRPFTSKFTQEERDIIVRARDTVVKAAVEFMGNL